MRDFFFEQPFQSRLLSDILAFSVQEKLHYVLTHTCKSQTQVISSLTELGLPSCGRAKSGIILGTCTYKRTTPFMYDFIFKKKIFIPWFP